MGCTSAKARILEHLFTAINGRSSTLGREKHHPCRMPDRAPALNTTSFLPSRYQRTMPDVILLLSFRWTDPTMWPWVVWFLPVFFLVGWIKPVRRRINTRQANSWPSVTGKIESVDVNEPKGVLGLKTSQTPRYFAEITYSYGVDGNTYTGMTPREFGNQDEAWDFLRDLQGKAVAVQYNPRNPETSSLSGPSLDALLQTRPPMPPGSSLAPPPKIPQWATLFLWFFAGLSLIGLILSLYVHINALMGNKMTPMFWGLHVGIFVVWPPAMFVARKRLGTTRRIDFWKAALQGAPDWMRYMTYAFLFYAAAGLLLLMADATAKGSAASAPANAWRDACGYWMAFYSAAFAILYVAATESSAPRCVNGHLLEAGEGLCSSCQQPALPPK
jgi:hypothetical protein